MPTACSDRRGSTSSMAPQGQQVSAIHGANDRQASSKVNQDREGAQPTYQASSALVPFSLIARISPPNVTQAASELNQ